MQNYRGKISIIMPAYNEGNHIYANIMETKQLFDGAGCRYEIIVVDDGSQDNTFSEAQRAVACAPEIIKLTRNTTNIGKGFAIREGFKLVTGDMVVFLDSDLELHPNQIKLLFEIMQQQHADVVIGSKRHPQSKLDYPLKRRIVSAVYFFLVKLLFGLPIRDTQTGLKLFKRNVLDEVMPVLLVKRFAFDLELLANIHHFGYTIAESPVIVNYRGKMRAHIGLRAIWQTWFETMAVFYRMHILKYYDTKKSEIRNLNPKS
ncbi:MAG: glycosyltransferase family 2 protein [bacterium]|nr:glycosyltransferase family 2 protein [bacterium]